MKFENWHLCARRWRPRSASHCCCVEIRIINDLSNALYEQAMNRKIGLAIIMRPHFNLSKNAEWSALRREKLRLKEIYELNSLDTIALLVNLGLGVSAVPNWMPPWPEGVHLRKFALPDAPEREIGIIWSRTSALGCGGKGEATFGMAAAGGATILNAFERGREAALAQQIPHCPGEKTFEHVALRRRGRGRCFEHEDRVLQAEARGALGDVEFIDAEAAPAALRKPLEIITECCFGGEIACSRGGAAPVERGFVGGRAQDGAIGFNPQRRRHGVVIIHQKMPRQVYHRQTIGPPDPGIGIDLDGDGGGHAATPRGFCKARRPS